MSVSLTLELQATGANTAGFHIPDDAVATLGGGGRPKVVATVDGYSWRSSIARMGGEYWLGVSQANRKAGGMVTGEVLELHLALDTAERTVEVPDDLAAALDAVPGARAAFDALAFTHRKEHARAIEEAKRAETRARRIEATVAAVTAKA